MKQQQTNRNLSLPRRGSRRGLLKLLKARIAYYYAKLKAEQLNKFTGRRYFVLMTDSGKLMVMDKTIFYKLRKRGHMPRQIQPHMLQRISVYYTAQRPPLAMHGRKVRPHQNAPLPQLHSQPKLKKKRVCNHSICTPAFLSFYQSTLLVTLGVSGQSGSFGLLV